MILQSLAGLPAFMAYICTALVAVLDPDCARGGSPTGGGHGGSGGWGSRRSLFGGDEAANRAPSADVSDAGSGNVTRGGFGRFARAFTAHFSFGG